MSRTSKPQLASAHASESQVREKLSAKTPEGEQDEIANVKAQIARAEAQLADASGASSRPSTTRRPTARWFARPAPGRDGRAATDDARDDLRRGRAVDPGDLPPERGAQGQARPGGGDRAQDVSGPHHQVQGGLDHVGDRAGAAADRRRRARPPASRRSRRNSLAVRLLASEDKDLFLASGRAGRRRDLHRQRRR